MLCQKLPFEEAEYRDRITRVREIMSENNIQILLIYDQRSMYYLFGYDQYGYWPYQVIVLTINGPVIALVRTADKFLAKAGVFIDKVETWRDYEDDPISKTVEIIKHISNNSGGKSIGAELNSNPMTGRHYIKLMKSLSNFTRNAILDSSDMIAEIRLTKSINEINHAVTAGIALKKAFNGVRDQLSADVKESELALVMLKNILDTTGEQPCAPILCASGSKTLSITHLPASQKIIKNNEVVTIEAGASSSRYHVVAANTYCAGISNIELEDSLEEISETIDVGKKMLCPGVPIYDVAAEMENYLDNKNKEFIRGLHFGYSTGIGYINDWLEIIRIHREDKHVLKEGMTLFLTSYCISKNSDYFVIKGMPYLINKNGSLCLAEI